MIDIYTWSVKIKVFEKTPIYYVLNYFGDIIWLTDILINLNLKFENLYHLS